MFKTSLLLHYGFVKKFVLFRMINLFVTKVTGVTPESDSSTYIYC